MSKVKDLFAKYEIGFRTYGKDVDKHFQEFEDEFNQLLIEARLDEQRRTNHKLNDDLYFYTVDDENLSQDERIAELQQSLKERGATQ